MKKKFLAHTGDIFTIEWYFDDRGFSEALEYFNDQIKCHQKKKKVLKAKKDYKKRFKGGTYYD